MAPGEQPFTDTQRRKPAGRAGGAHRPAGAAPSARTKSVAPTTHHDADCKWLAPYLADLEAEAAEFTAAIDDASRRHTDLLSLNSPAPVPNDLHNQPDSQAGERNPASQFHNCEKGI